MRLDSIFILIVALLPLTPSQAQNGGKADNDYYLFPIKPGQLNTLAGTMGEHRSTHFHTGIDIRTGSRIGIPVLAAADGYVSRVAVQSGGYGNALYITHSNKQITVYAHLNSFQTRLADHVRTEQYKRQKFELNLYPPKDKFPVRRGDTIAFSGNSGSSAGPHLHFDLRDINHKLLNPLEYNFAEVKDDLAPVANRIAFVTLDKEARINGRFGRFEFKLNRDKDLYYLDDTVSVYGEIGLELYAYDRQNFTLFRTGIPRLEMLVDGVLYYKREIETFSFSDQRNIHVHTNYRKKQVTGRRFEKLFIDDGNTLKFYQAQNDGRLHVNSEKTHELVVNMEDAYENKSRLLLALNGGKSSSQNHTNISFYRESDVDQNTLKMVAPTGTNRDKLAKLYIKDKTVDLLPTYSLNDTLSVYLWDLRAGLPDSAFICNSKKYFNFKAMVLPGLEYKFYSKEIDLTIPASALFDTLYFTGNYNFDPELAREHFVLHRDVDPLKRDISVILKPRKKYNRQGAAVFRTDRLGNLYYVGGEWQGDLMEFTTRNFGTYTIAHDTVPPTIRPLIINRDNLSFRIDDKLSGIEEFKLFVNEEWVLMNYEYKRDLIWSEKMDKNIPFEGELYLKVVDKLGNENEYRTTIR